MQGLACKGESNCTARQPIVVIEGHLNKPLSKIPFSFAEMKGDGTLQSQKIKRSPSFGLTST